MAKHIACPLCGQPLYLVTMQLNGIYDDGSLEGLSDDWYLECANDHKPWDSKDQIAADNEAGLTDDDLTGDYMPGFRYAAFQRRFRDDAAAPKCSICLGIDNPECTGGCL